MSEIRNSRKVRQGVVVSDVNDKTIVVQIKERKPVSYTHLTLPTN